MPAKRTPRKDSLDRLERRSVLAYCDRLLKTSSILDKNLSASQAVRMVREWARKWRPRADRVKGGRGR